MKASPRFAWLACVLFVSLSIRASGQTGAPPRLGLFEDHTDVGAVPAAGDALFDAAAQTYTVSGSGTNMWDDHDEFHFVWRRVSGDFVLQAMAELLGPGADPQRKTGLIVRSSLDARAPHVSIARHGDGLVSVQYRGTYGAPTEEQRFESAGADVFELSRRGDSVTVSVARLGDLYVTKTLDDLMLGGRVYVGLYVCAHHRTALEKALFRNVRLVRPAKPDFAPYRDYLGSELETVEVATGRRRVLFQAPDSLQAPNWTPDGKRLIYNQNGRMFSFDLAKAVPTLIDTGDQVRNNNDHALSFDGRRLGISSGEVSTVYVLPVKGGKPTQVTTENPSYLHGWSPDGKFLVYTGIRNGDADLYRIPVKGGAEQRLTDAKGVDDGSEYTPDGKSIFFNSERSGRMQIWKMKADGSAQEQVTNDEFNNWFPHVSPDGKTLLFLTYGPEVPSAEHPFYRHVYLRKMDVSGGKVSVVAYVYGGQGSINVNSWSPDSKLVAFVSNGDRFP